MNQPPSRAASLLDRFAIGLALALSAAQPAPAAENPTYDAARELADKIQGMTQGKGGAAPAPAEPLAKADPCKLLSDAEARQYFPKAKAGERERTREKYGITACIWDHPTGKLVLQLTLGAKPGSSREEAEGIAIGFTDPFNQAARKQIRFETVEGVGSEAVAVVEKADDKRGILSDAAYLYTQRGDVQLMVMAPDLARGDRAAALKTMREIGRVAAGRL
jgi:hypothetical protein